MGLKSGKLLDFGCGNGVHCKYFEAKGFESYGVDIVDCAIMQAKKHIGDRAKLIKPNASLLGIFEKEQFDIIFANQSLYYLDNTHLKICVEELYSLCKSGGICFFTMMSSKNDYAKRITKKLDNGLAKVVLTGRLNETSYINFVESVENLIEIFKPFKPLYVGEYDGFYLYPPYSDEGSSHHYIFIGQKV